MIFLEIRGGACVPFGQYFGSCVETTCSRLKERLGNIVTGFFVIQYLLLVLFHPM